jgi:hypothetical protein
MATESQIFANQQNDQKSAKWQGQHNKMRQIIGGKLTLIMQNKANRRPLAGNPKHEILNPKRDERMLNDRAPSTFERARF